MPPVQGMQGLDPEFARRLGRLIAASGGKLWITSGYRSTAEQQVLYDAYEAGTGNLAAVPGTSNHEFGLAVDLGGDLAWANANGHRYGLHFPVNGEAWHVEMTGAADRMGSGSGTAGTYDPSLGWALDEPLSQPSDPVDIAGGAIRYALANPQSTRILGNDGRQQERLSAERLTPELNQESQALQQEAEPDG